MGVKTVYHQIKELLTFQGVAQKDGRHITEDDLSIIRDGAIVCSEGNIVWIGCEKDLPVDEFSSDQLIWNDLKGETVLPGFVDAHTHSIFAGTRCDEFEMRIKGATYENIARSGGGILSTVSKTRAASETELTYLAQRRIGRFLEQGVTTLEVKSGYGLSLEAEKKILRVAQKLRGVQVVATYLGPHANSPDFSNRENYFDEILRRHLPEIAREKLAQRVDIFVERGYYTIDEARSYIREAKNLGFQASVHADQLSRTGGARLAVELEVSSADHLVCVDDEDIRCLSQSQTTAVLLPSADFYLRISYPPARKMIDSGVRVALGTDFNPGSSPTQDIQFVGLLARNEMKMTLPEVLSAFTYGGACALGFQDEIGTLSVGKKAHFSVWDQDWRELFYEVGGARPKLTVC